MASVQKAGPGELKPLSPENSRWTAVSAFIKAVFFAAACVASE